MGRRIAAYSLFGLGLMLLFCLSPYWARISQGAQPSPAISERPTINVDQDAKARAMRLEMRLKNLEASLAAAESRIERVEAALNQLKLGYEKHTHTYEKPFLGAAWNLPTLNANLNNGNYLVRVINNAQIPSSSPTGSTGKPQ